MVYSPSIVKKFIDNLPIINERGIVLEGNRLAFKANINTGVEKPTMSVKKGDIAYQPLGDEILIFFEDVDKTFSKVNVIGNLKNTSDITNILKKITLSAKISVKLSESE